MTTKKKGKKKSTLEEARKLAAAEQARRIEIACERHSSSSKKKKDSFPSPNIKKGQKFASPSTSSSKKRKAPSVDNLTTTLKPSKINKKSTDLHLETPPVSVLKDTTTVEGDDIRQMLLRKPKVEGNSFSSAKKDPMESATAFAVRVAAERQKIRDEDSSNSNFAKNNPLLDLSAVDSFVKDTINIKQQDVLTDSLFDSFSQINKVQKEPEGDLSSFKCDSMTYASNGELPTTCGSTQSVCSSSVSGSYFGSCSKFDNPVNFDQYDPDFECKQENNSEYTSSDISSVSSDQLSVLQKDLNDSENDLDSLQYADITTWCFLCIAAISLFLLFFTITGSFADVPFCNTFVNGSGIQDTSICQPCPANANCTQGVVAECIDPYVVVNGNKCVENSLVKSDALTIVEFLKKTAKKNADEFFFSSSFLSLLKNRYTYPKYSKISINSLRTAARNDPRWKNLPDNIFSVAFQNAIRKFVGTHGIHLKDSDLLIEVSQSSFLCQLTYFIFQHLESLFASLVLIMVSYFLLKRHQRVNRNKSLVKKMIFEVHDKLIDHSDTSTSELQGYPCVNLRDHIFDSLCLNGKARQYAAENLWPIVTQTIYKDSRIRQRFIMYKGHQVLFWEWISPDKTKTSERVKLK